MNTNVNAVTIAALEQILALCTNMLNDQKEEMQKKLAFLENQEKEQLKWAKKEGELEYREQNVLTDMEFQEKKIHFKAWEKDLEEREAKLKV